MSWYSASRDGTAASFPLDHPSKPDRSSCWKRVFFLCSTDILTCWLPWILSSLSRVLGVNFTEGTVFMATNWVTLMPLGMPWWWLEWSLGFLPLLELVCPCSHFGVCVHHTHSVKQVGSFTFPQCLSHYMHVTSHEKIFIWPCIILDEKASISSHLVVLTTSFKLAGSAVGRAVASLLTENPAQWHANIWDIINPFKEAANSSILLSLITLTILLMDGVPRITSTWDTKVVESG